VEALDQSRVTREKKEKKEKYFSSAELQMLTFQASELFFYFLFEARSRGAGPFLS
jgi:hypothetical protein